MTEPGQSKTAHCTVCGHVLSREGEFHPYMFCVLKKAGRKDPWEDFKWAAEALGLERPSGNPITKRPPLVAGLPERK